MGTRGKTEKRLIKERTEWDERGAEKMGLKGGKKELYTIKEENEYMDERRD